MSTLAPALAEGAPGKPSALRKLLALDVLDNRYPALHGLRVLAIITVVQFHVTAIFRREGLGLHPEFVEGSQRLFFGMDLFFILSGFLIGSILLRSLQLSGTQNLKRFYLRRVLRTFPSYYVVLTVLALATKLGPEQRRHLPWEYLYGTNFFPMHGPSVVMIWGWSLALEEQFYLTVPLLFFVLHRLRSDRARLTLLGALWGSALAVRLGIFLHGRPWFDWVLDDALYFRTYTRYDTLVVGILLAFVHRSHGAAIHAWLEHPGHRAWLSIFALSCLWILVRPEIFGAENVQLMHVFAWGTLTSLMYFPLLLLLLHRDGAVQRWLSAEAFRRTATLGYGVYLVHIPLIDHVILPLARRLHARHVSMFLIWPAGLSAAMAASLAIAYAMHVLIEKPSLWIRERLAA